MPKIFTSKTQKIGEFGEKIAEKFLKDKGYKIVGKNFCSRNGEIDIIADIGGVRHFVEVKSSILRSNGVLPVENMTAFKIQKQRAVISDYLRQKKGVYDWQIDVLLVSLDIKDKVAKVEYLECAF